MAFDLTAYTNDVLKTMAGRDITRVTELERVGYLRAMLDCIDHMEKQAMIEPNIIIAAGLRVAARELSNLRAEKLRALPQ